MLSDDDKKEMMDDAHNLQRRKDFAFARELVQERKLTGEEYLKYLTSLTTSSLQTRVFKKIEGHTFKL